MKEGLTFVMGVNLIIWCGIALYLFMLDRKIGKLEHACQDKQVLDYGRNQKL
ncbi:MAG: CcmD family protein [Desulfobacterales bacterium]|nr:CcmD family protein [Desulfobacterales bacterium]